MNKDSYVDVLPFNFRALFYIYLLTSQKKNILRQYMHDKELPTELAQLFYSLAPPLQIYKQMAKTKIPHRNIAFLFHFII